MVILLSMDSLLYESNIELIKNGMITTHKV